jgi:hypothetical protein
MSAAPIAGRRAVLDPFPYVKGAGPGRAGNQAAAVLCDAGQQRTQVGTVCIGKERLGNRRSTRAELIRLVT